MEEAQSQPHGLVPSTLLPFSVPDFVPALLVTLCALEEEMLEEEGNVGA